MLTFPDVQWPLAFNPDGSQFAVAESDPAPGAPDAVRVFATCPACSNPRGLLALARPLDIPPSQRTVLENTVIGSS